MSYKIFSRAGFVAAISLALSPGIDARAQGIDPPPITTSESSTGVVFGTGAFTYSVTDLSIGGDVSQGGLSLVRKYMSSLNAVYSSGFQAQGWTYNLHVSVTASKARTNRVFPTQSQPYLYSVAFGDRSVPFVGGSSNPTGGVVGTYSPLFFGSEKLVYVGTEQSGTFTFTSGDGSIILIQDSLVRSWTMPNGVVLTYNYNSSSRLASIFSNRGYALLFEGTTRWTKACAVNLTTTYVTSQSTCPPGVQTVSYTYTPDGLELASATDSFGNTTSYSYVGAGTQKHLSCITDPGQVACRISNQYNTCQWDTNNGSQPSKLRLWDQVTSQTTITGETYNYSFPASPFCPLALPRAVTETAASGFSLTVGTNDSGAANSSIDALSRTTSAAYSTLAGPVLADSPFPDSVTLPGGQMLKYQYDPRKNITERRKVAAPSSGLADLVSTASYPSCTSANQKTCNKPDFVIDDRGNRTDYVYDTQHGGVLTETRPSVTVNGGGTLIAPVKRYAYVQRYAWVSDGAGGYVHGSGPIWLLATEKTCHATATNVSTDSCAGGANDEVVTAFDYGSDSGPNNLLLRGITVTAVTPNAGGTLVSATLRTCYGYDAQGNRISETKPRANLTVCP